MSNAAAASILLRQFRELTDPKKGVPCFHIELEDDNIFLWNIGVMVLNKESIYHGGYFKGQMKFPLDFPFSPPTFRFTPAIYHPNVYRDGRLCISILHQGGGDPTTDEPDSETWSPAQTVESVLISIVSLLEDPNISSPANVDAAVDYRKNTEKYKERVLQEVERSRQDIPEGFIMPDADTAYGQPRAEEPEQDAVDDDFWFDSDESYGDDDSIMDGNVSEDDDNVDNVSEDGMDK
ncbi:Ubiquitin-conjugating enzyme subunit [Komagataella phaffii CBS 7435]|uniref:Ubiquitin-conjugating enzyme (E2) and catalytic subunit of SCF ubiquitin-protein ligase complex n=3 Tax=Komagataella TaxID=460517 RepID=C4QV28_KOMPG|nr:Ubiquitin-conjugating enzyme (E2) and catalytic subunit of SCF ubiquitin-protein ligase complex [Komagataella phaffii GS115]ANZ73900.1 BA75_01820T0 [Komagataella pastoris]AOA61817.1 GQ67_02298T0 [Komagataella phaffii]KAI0465464.1 Ubiquitin-conjugating enzyme subunit [Komagataella kurtzmanii]CAH2445753.1 Ubiquitin-conjugating enzyme subunit [Komagataella phaffii CBS 7435]AOA66299.1 GQ68_02949T0 [Komagataella phaffii GS115]